MPKIYLTLTKKEPKGEWRSDDFVTPCGKETDWVNLCMILKEKVSLCCISFWPEDPGSRLEFGTGTSFSMNLLEFQGKPWIQRKNSFIFIYQMQCRIPWSVFPDIRSLWWKSLISVISVGSHFLPFSTTWYYHFLPSWWNLCIPFKWWQTSCTGFLSTAQSFCRDWGRLASLSKEPVPQLAFLCWHDWVCCTYQSFL